MSTLRAHGKHVLSLDGQPARKHIPCVGIGLAIKGAREAAGRSQRWLSEQVGQAQTTVSSWERGRTEPGREDVQRVAAALNMTAAALEGGSREPLTVALLGDSGAGDAAHFYSEDQGELGRVETDDADAISAREIRGRSMGRMLEGWLVFTGARQPSVPDAYLGKICEVALPDGRVLVKQVRRAKLPGVFHLYSETEEPMLDEEVEWSAVVTSMRPR